MKKLKRLIYISIVLVLLLIIFTEAVFADGNTFIIGDLRVDLPEIYYS